ncbi:MAG TPA: hypothetical protein VKQ72_11315 [Aggregatilineales bacterium]|nr:hypothetical protein [Aggregatilineales bacterium]
MQQAQAIIERVRRVSASTQHLDLAVEKSQRNVEAGQIFLARRTESSDPYLREPWTPVSRNGGTVVVERPATQHYTPGDVVNLIGPVGKPIPLRDTARNLLLIAYDSAPTSLLMLADDALRKKMAVTLALVGTALHYPLDGLSQEIEIIRGDSEGAWPEQAETLRWAEQIVAVAPPPFDLLHYGRLLSALQDIRLDVPSDYAYVLYQPPMPCGVGACRACLLDYGKEEAMACQDGPAFDLIKLKAVTREAGR